VFSGLGAQVTGRKKLKSFSEEVDVNQANSDLKGDE
jgi:hypothetical protein